MILLYWIGTVRRGNVAVAEGAFLLRREAITLSIGLFLETILGVFCQ